MSQQQMNDEQQKELMEKIKKMSPEELREFQKKQCIFCQISSGKMQAKMVYEDDKAIAILDINPANIGHILLLPKEHYSIMPQLPPEEMSHLGILAKKMSHVLLKALKAAGTTVFIANGAAAGQRAQHFMIHIIPRNEKDGVTLFIPQQQIKEEDLEKLREAIVGRLGTQKQQKKEGKIEKPEKTEKKVEKKPKEKVKEKPKEKATKKVKQSKKEDAVGLDDIAGLFGG
jgi:histidine triad (HIT) family protein